MKNNKLSKSALKGIIKECLIEILAEGLVSSPRTSSGRSTKRSKSSVLKEQILDSRQVNYNSSGAKSSARSSHLDSISYNETDNNLKKNKKLEQLASNITTDPILTEMLSDTAYTTLQEQIKAENTKGYTPSNAGDAAQKQVASNDPEALFGAEAASKWASLAFDS